MCIRDSINAEYGGAVFFSFASLTFLSLMARSILVWGGSGALGSNVVESFAVAGWTTVSVDFRNNPKATHNILLENSDPETSTAEVSKKVAELVPSKLDVVACTAGGWAGGDIASPDIFKSLDFIWKSCVISAVSAGHLASQQLKEGGLLVFTGANVALKGATPGMVSYGAGKAATHHIVSSLSQPNSGLPKSATVLAILPIDLDTPANRAGRPDPALWENWTPLEHISEQLLQWANSESRPETGSLFSLLTEKRVTAFKKQ
eukprot:TRINITY_DN123_c0_g1_i4.p1 TRINITY_DN123_c0_g1~~TRINITY_DN123_c0_g1_i4.p1  ORF type:complete len:262 (-),score=67.05 TRINITY_DN123_c0_g1_i4:52-837(-)